VPRLIRPSIVLLILVLSNTSLPAHAAWRESEVAIKSRGEVTVKILVAEAANKDGTLIAPTDVAIFFPGADGRARPPREGISQHGVNPSSMGLMAEKFGVGIAVGPPSDQADGISVAWRGGAEHIGDAAAVIDWVSAKYPMARITLIGMSNGARSVTNIAAALARRGSPKPGSPNLAGVVVLSAAPEALAEATMQPIRAANIPILVMHHKRDSCLLYRDIEPIAKRYVFVTIDDPKQPEVSLLSRSCGRGSAHEFSGKLDEVYTRIIDWVRAKPAPAAN
jgi:alpha/beta superfamily hydrolase